MRNFIFFTLYILLVSHEVWCKDNGVARTPPMGWLSWQRFRCETDCKQFPDSCISENLYKTMGELLVSEGYRSVGYEYVNIDDCWAEKQRDANGRLVPNKQRFPNGIKSLSQYMHKRGLKLGIYDDIGTKTCAGYPGVLYHFPVDAQTFAEWDIDHLKMDACNTYPGLMDTAFPEFSTWLNRTGRQMVFSCEWPHEKNPPYKEIPNYCNTWRFGGDIQDSWTSVTSIVNSYRANVELLSNISAPGSFNDPDMIIIGNFGLSHEQQRSQMALWSMMAAPLLMSNDLRNMDPISKAILQNRNVIEIDQDPLGLGGKPILESQGVEVWRRPIRPSGSFALLFCNFGDRGVPAYFSFKLKTLGLTNVAGYNVTELFDNVRIGKLNPDSFIKAFANPSGVYFIKAVNINF